MGRPWLGSVCSLMRVLSAAGALAGGCDTVALGPPPADVNACRPNEQFFYERIWPEFLSIEHTGRRCYDSGCHDAASPRALRLPVPTSAPGLPLPPDWQAIYRSAADQLTCTNPSASRLVTKPSQSNHGPGMPLIDPGGPEAALVRAWVEAR